VARVGVPTSAPAIQKLFLAGLFDDRGDIEIGGRGRAGVCVHWPDLLAVVTDPGALTALLGAPPHRFECVAPPPRRSTRCTLVPVAAKKLTKPKKKSGAKQPGKPAATSAGRRSAKKSGGTLPAFPFYGAGEAHYFEWFEMWVWFAEPVAKTRRASIVKMAPKLCQLDAQWPADDLLWASTGDQWIQQHLVETYGTAKAKQRMAGHRKRLEEDEDADPWGGDTDELLAVGDEEQQFNAEIDAWLGKLHAQQPILFVARREDGEAGGTKLSAWHKASLARWKELEPKVHAALAKQKRKKDDLRVAPIRIAAHFVGLGKVSDQTRALAAHDDD
jgi:hypothetical protein